MDKNGSNDQYGPKWPKKLQNDKKCLKKKLKLPKTTDTTGTGMSMAKMAKKRPNTSMTGQIY